MRETLSVVRRIGVRRAAAAAAERGWSRSASFGLAADLDELPTPRPARIPVQMLPCGDDGRRDFAQELDRVAGGDRVEVAQRLRMCEAGVGGLHIARADDGSAIYAQWLVDHATQDALHAITHGIFPRLEGGESLVEGAYTFVRFRKQGAMAAGMHQLLEAARAAGASRCLTYVSHGNVASLRGCARAGFSPDHVREHRWRVGRRSIRFLHPTAQDTAVWQAAVAPTPA